MPFIEDLDPQTPDNNDVAGVTDDELRALKLTLNDQFVGEAGDLYDTAIIVGPRALNQVKDKADGADLAALDARVATLETSQIQQQVSIDDHEARITAIEADYTTASEAAGVAWPVGSLFVSADGATPTAKGLPGTWSAVADGRVLLGDPTTGQEDGANSITLTAAQLPAHKHSHVTHRQQSGDGTGTIPNTYFQSPARSFDSVRGGTNSPDARFAIYNTDEGPGSGAAVDITPAHYTVRFYRRTA